MNFSLVFGGKSFEHEISIVSAISVAKVLGEVKHFIFLDDTHKFYLIPKEEMKSSTFSSGKYKKCKRLMLGLKDFHTIGIFGHKKIGVECVLSLIHGGDGEDGVLSSLLDFHFLPYIAPRPKSAVLSYDKELTKLYAKDRGVEVLPYEVFDRKNPPKALGHYPSIIKPLRLGSSIGVGIVKTQEELEYQLDRAFEYDESVLIEPFVEGVKEYNLAGYKNKQGEMVYSIVEEPKKAEFLNFEDKYLDFSRTQKVYEAEISEDLQSKLQENFKKLYENCFEGALIRCDFFVIEDRVYLNEINPIPGSMANYLFADFKQSLQDIALPSPREIRTNYAYIHKIQSAKGKC